MQDDEIRRTASAEEANRWTRVRVQQIPNPKRSKTTSVTDNENLADQMDVVAKTKMVNCDPSHADPAKAKVIDKVVRHTNILGAPFPDLLNKDGKLINYSQIIIAHKLLERKNDFFVIIVSRVHCVTSNNKYITIVSTEAETAVVYLGLESRSVHNVDRRGFTVKPTAKYVDECLEIEQQESLDLRDETAVCDQVQHSELLLEKLQYITG